MLGARDVARSAESLRRLLQAVEHEELTMSNYKRELTTYKNILSTLVRLVESLANVVAAQQPPKAATRKLTRRKKET